MLVEETGSDTTSVPQTHQSQCTQGNDSNQITESQQKEVFSGNVGKNIDNVWESPSSRFGNESRSSEIQDDELYGDGSARADTTEKLKSMSEALKESPLFSVDKPSTDQGSSTYSSMDIIQQEQDAASTVSNSDEESGSSDEDNSSQHGDPKKRRKKPRKSKEDRKKKQGRKKRNVQEKRGKSGKNDNYGSSVDKTEENVSLHAVGTSNSEKTNRIVTRSSKSLEVNKTQEEEKDSTKEKTDENKASKTASNKKVGI
ncbi:uncharacterized protein [Argopecten irradians]|uniref:uncharacterized protein n=1 Tax=Argopecten irradians TaxID=31199 RepID=UPI00371E794A